MCYVLCVTRYALCVTRYALHVMCYTLCVVRSHILTILAKLDIISVDKFKIIFIYKLLNSYPQ